MQMPEFTGSYWDNYSEWVAYWEWIRNRRFHARQEDKGIPVPHTGVRRYRKSVNGSGVSASSRVLSHYYANEGEKGSYVRKLVRSRERQMWRDEWLTEQNEDAYYGYAVDTYSAGEWFSDDPYEWDWYYGEDDYPMWVDMGCGDPHCVMCEREFNIEHTEWEERFGCSLPDCVEIGRAHV